MAKPSYARAIDDVLQPLGFSRAGGSWTRVRGDMHEHIGLQSFRGGPGVNVNFVQWDLQTARLAETIFGAPKRCLREARLDELTFGRDYWWKGYGADGPPALTAALIKHGLPWFDGDQNLERQLEHWFNYKALKRARSSYGWVQIAAALTLCRMGRLQEACEVMNKPIPARAPRESFEDLERVRQWLQLPPRTRQQAEFRHPIIRWLGLG